MTVLSKSVFNLLRRCEYRFIVTRHGSWKILSSDNQKVQKIEKCTDGSTKREQDNILNENKIAQKDKANIKVCIIGGGVTPLYTAVLLKQYRIIKSIRLVDAKDSMLEALRDVSHLETNPRIEYFRRKDIKQALREANVIALMDNLDINVAGNMTIQEQFKSTTDYVRQVTDQILRFSPDAFVAVFVRPVTATLAMVSEMFRCSGCWNPDRIIGSTAKYSNQIEESTAAILNLDRSNLSVPLAGGADMHIVVPLLSRVVPFNQFTNVQRKTLLQSFRIDDKKMRTELLREDLSLSSGTAATKLLINIAAALSGHMRVITCAYVRSDVLPICRYFTSELELGPEGIKRNLGLPKISSTEVLQIEQAIPLINKYVDMATAAVRTERTRAKIQ